MYKKKEIFHFLPLFLVFLIPWLLEKGFKLFNVFRAHMRAELLPHIRPLFPPSKSIPWTGSPPHTHTQNNTQKNRTKTNRTGNTWNERRRHQFFEKAFKKGPPEKRRASCLMSFYREDTCIIFILGLFFQGGVSFLVFQEDGKKI